MVERKMCYVINVDIVEDTALGCRSAMQTVNLSLSKIRNVGVEGLIWSSQCYKTLLFQENTRFDFRNCSSGIEHLESAFLERFGSTMIILSFVMGAANR